LTGQPTWATLHAAIMKTFWLLTLGLFAAHSGAQRVLPLQPDPPIECESCLAWNAPRKPTRVFGNTYYVGPLGLGSVLITSDAGHILLDGGLPQSAAVINQNISALGFRLTDVRLIVNSHAHYDHAGGIAALQRASRATVAASASGARVLEQGELGSDDPQYGYGPNAGRFPPATNVRVAKDGEVLRVGTISVTAHLTPGHTSGSTTWSWRSCESERCQDIVYADSLNPVSAPSFRFTADEKGQSRIEVFRRSIAKVAALPCDVLIAVHPQLGVDKTCRTYAEDFTKRLDQRIAEERR
jgi:metallo-beta-lactamase class B